MVIKDDVSSTSSGDGEKGALPAVKEPLAYHKGFTLAEPGEALDVRDARGHDPSKPAWRQTVDK